MKLGNLKYLFFIIFFIKFSIVFAQDSIESVPLINLEELSPTFEEDKSELENEKNRQKINSVCKFEFVEDVKSKNIDQNNKDLNLKLLAIDLLKNKDKFEINLIFNNNSCITLSTEIVEVTLEDQNKI